MTAVCRGCGGNGVGQHVSSREVQVIEAHQPILLVRKFGRRLHLVSATASVDADHQPLAPLVIRLRERMAAGFRPSPNDDAFVEMLLERADEWACTWCHGTGVPQLSIHALENGVA